MYIETDSWVTKIALSSFQATYVKWNSNDQQSKRKHGLATLILSVNHLQTSCQGWLSKTVTRLKLCPFSASSTADGSCVPLWTQRRLSLTPLRKVSVPLLLGLAFTHSPSRHTHSVYIHIHLSKNSIPVPQNREKKDPGLLVFNKTYPKIQHLTLYLHIARSLELESPSLLGFLIAVQFSCFNWLTQTFSSIFLFLGSVFPLFKAMLVAAESSSSVSPANFLLLFCSILFLPLIWSFFIFRVWPLA